MKIELKFSQKIAAQEERHVVTFGGGLRDFDDSVVDHRAHRARRPREKGTRHA